VTCPRCRDAQPRVINTSASDDGRVVGIYRNLRHKDLAGFEDLHLPAGTSPRVIA